MTKTNDYIDQSLEKILDEPSNYLGHLNKSILNILFGKLNYFSDYLDETRKIKNEERLKNFLNKHNKIPDDKKCCPPFETISKFGNDIINYVDNDSISDMFYNLLLSSFNIDLANYVHPAFHDIIKQLSPIDARMLKDIKYKSTIEGFTVLKNDSNSLPISLIKTDLIYEFGIEQCAFSISNLKRLGLIDMDVFLLEKNSTRFAGINNGVVYFETLDDWKIEKTEYPKLIEEAGYTAYKCNIFLNSFGQNFLNVCIE